MRDRKGNVGIIVSANTGGGTPSASLNIKAKLTPRQFIIKKGLRHK